MYSGLLKNSLRQVRWRTSMVMHVSEADTLWSLLKDTGASDGIIPCGAKQGGQLVGFCQAIMPGGPSPAEHTRSFTELLISAQAKYSKSHELFLGHWNSARYSFEDWFSEASGPLANDTGCVPVLITGLTAGCDTSSVIFSSLHKLGEPVLVRMLVNEKSLDQAVSLMQRLVDEITESKKVPNWYPLFQASSNTGLDLWRKMSEMLGANWKYVCVATDPFASDEVRGFLKWQTVVAQIPIGRVEDIADDMVIPTGMLSAFPDGCKYNLAEYLGSLDKDKKDILIVLGPSKPGWSVEYNKSRITKIAALMAGNGITI